MKNSSPIISAITQVCAVIGNPVKHSLSPAIHNAAFQAMGLDFVYVAFRVEDVQKAVMGMRALENFRGLSVTIPHKIEIMKHLDEISDLDQRIGSINTVISEKGHLRGLGTDGPGALKALQDAGVDLKSLNILILGAGGASRAIAFTLADSGGPEKITLLDIDEPLLGCLARDLEAVTGVHVHSEKFTDRSLSVAMDRADLVIHCTPVGMHPNIDKTLVPKDLFRPGQVVFDVVYTPLKTKLLVEAEAKGLKTISGVEMFINQAILQFEQFTGMSAPEDVMRKVVMDQLRGED